MIIYSIEHQPDLRQWLSHKIGYAMPENSFCLGQMRKTRLVGVVGFCHHINKSVMIHSAGVDKHWVTRDLLLATFDFPFNQLGCNVLIGQVGSNNTDALRFNEHLGFKPSCIISDAHEDGDLIIMTMYRAECRYLDKLMHNEEEQCATA